MLNILYLVPGAWSGIWDMALRLYYREGSSCRDKAGACSTAETSLGRSRLPLTYSIPLARPMPLPSLGKEDAPVEDSEAMVKTRMAKIRPFSSLYVDLDTLQTNKLSSESVPGKMQVR